MCVCVCVCGCTHYETVNGSSSFQSIVFKPRSEVMRASNILCDCDLCMVEYGSCHNFQDYHLRASRLSWKVLRSEYKEFSTSDECIDNTSSEFFVPESFAAIAADKKSTQMVYFVLIKSSKQTNDKTTPIEDDYGHLVGPGISFYECAYMEEHTNSKKGITYRLTEQKTVFVFKESFVYPYVNFKQ